MPPKSPKKPSKARRSTAAAGNSAKNAKKAPNPKPATSTLVLPDSDDEDEPVPSDVERVTAILKEKSGEGDMSEDSLSESSQSDGSDSSEEEDEPEPVVVKRKPGRPKKAQGERLDEQNAPVEAPDVVYTIAIYSLAEMAKAKTRRQPENRILKLKPSVPWIDFEDQVKLHVIKVLFPNAPVPPARSQYRIFYAIRGGGGNLVPLESEDDYGTLLDLAKNKNNTYSKVSISVQEQARPGVDENESNKRKRKDGDDDDEDTDNDSKSSKKKDKKKKKKTEAEKRSEELEGNMAINTKIQEVRARWECSAVGHTHCYVSPEVGAEHLRLTHEHVEKWAAAIVASVGKDVPLATIDVPPQHRLFDAVGKKKEMSPILQARLNAAAKEKGPQPSSAPVINVVFPNDMFGALRHDTPHHLPAPNAAVAAPAAPSGPQAHSDALIPHGYGPGPKTSLEDFCAQYDLTASVLQRFQDHAYRWTSGFKYMSVSGLCEMGFKQGEIAEIRDAVESWAEAVAQ